MIKVKYIGENGKYGFAFGEFYNAYEIKGNVPNKKDIIAVVDKHGEEYAYPKEWFEIVEQ
jgi:hypothetical protein